MNRTRRLFFSLAHPQNAKKVSCSDDRTARARARDTRRSRTWLVRCRSTGQALQVGLDERPEQSKRCFRQHRHVRRQISTSNTERIYSARDWLRTSVVYLLPRQNDCGFPFDLLSPHCHRAEERDKHRCRQWLMDERSIRFHARVRRCSFLPKIASCRSASRLSKQHVEISPSPPRMMTRASTKLKQRPSVQRYCCISLAHGPLADPVDSPRTEPRR